MSGNMGKVPELREAFLSKYNGSILDDTYDQRDVDWVKEDDRFLCATLDTFKAGGDVKKACDLLNECLLFRAKFKLNDLKEEDLHQFYKDSNGIFFHGVDKQGHKILVFRICKAKKGYEVEEGKKYIAYKMNQHYRQHPEERICILYDFFDAGVGNMDLDISKFLTEASRIYFPNIVEYGLMFKMSTPLEAIWRIISTFLDPHQKKTTKFVKRSNIQEYIDKDQLLEHMVKEEKK